MDLNHFSLARNLLIAGTLAGFALAATPSQAQNDPPPGAARVARIQGNVSIQPDGVDSWEQAYTNQPLGPGDRLYTDEQSKGELQAEQVRAYFSSNSDLTLINLDQNGVELGMAQGSVNIFSDGFPPGTGSVNIETPNGAIGIASRANFRVDVFADEQSTVITNFQNSSELALNGGGGFYLPLRPGESVQLTGTNPVYAQALEPAANDQFASWSNSIESRRFNSVSARYVNAEMPGYDELDANGDWQPESDYGPIWFPRVEAGWAPYHYGHWVNMPFYGWTWVADEPWGAAPFHYGRWAQVRGRWGWIPGPRESHPIWSPAQVVFAGGVRFGGAGVSVWFPLGPGEAYKPWYPCSPQYVDRVNITNIHESRAVHVQNTYINVVNVTNVTYVNRTVGVTAMRQEDFAAGHSTRAVAVRVDARQLERIQPARPEARAPVQPVILHPVVRPVAVSQQRPVLINNRGQQAVAAPNVRPVPVPVKVAPPAPRPIPGRVAIGTPILGGKPVAAPLTPAPAQPVNPAQPINRATPLRPILSPPGTSDRLPQTPTPPPAPPVNRAEPLRPSPPPPGTSGRLPQTPTPPPAPPINRAEPLRPSPPPPGTDGRLPQTPAPPPAPPVNRTEPLRPNPPPPGTSGRLPQTPTPPPAPPINRAEPLRPSPPPPGTSGRLPQTPIAPPAPPVNRAEPLRPTPPPPGTSGRLPQTPTPPPPVVRTLPPPPPARPAPAPVVKPAQPASPQERPGRAATEKQPGKDGKKKDERKDEKKPE